MGIYKESRSSNNYFNMCVYDLDTVESTIQIETYISQLYILSIHRTENKYIINPIEPCRRSESGSDDFFTTYPSDYTPTSSLFALPDDDDFKTAFVTQLKKTIK